MKFKKLLIISAILASTVACSDSDNTNQDTSLNDNTAAQQSERAEQTIVENTPEQIKSEFLAQFKDYSMFPLDEVEDEELLEYLESSITEYENNLSEIYDIFQEHFEQAQIERQDNINELKEILSEQEDVFTKECSEINSRNENPCNQLGERNAKLKTQINRMEVDLKNTIGEMKADRLNAMQEQREAMEKNVGNLLIQGGYL